MIKTLKWIWELGYNKGYDDAITDWEREGKLER